MTAQEYKNLLTAYMQNIVNQQYHSDACGSCRKVHAGSCQLPDAYAYVCSNDTFMSGWGWSKGQINVCVVPCADHEEVKRVLEYIERRTDQNYVRVCYNKPRPRGRKLSLLLQWRWNALGLPDVLPTVPE